MKPKLVDVHTHLQFLDFDKDRDETIERAFNEGVYFINVGANKKSSQRAVELADKYSTEIWATVGQHPSDLKDFDYGFFKNLAQNQKVVAIGECGLDYYKLKQSIDREAQIAKQKEIFIKQIELAKEVKKPLMIHCRDAFDDLIKILTSHILFLNTPPGILHFFTGTKENAKTLLEMGFYFTFNGLITFNRDFDEIIKFIPLERILLETDAPYVSPAPYRGKRNEPSYIIETAKKLAEIKSVAGAFEEISDQTTKNAEVVFGLKI